MASATSRRNARDRDGTIDAVACAFLAPTFTPIDDVRIFTTMAMLMRGLVDDYLFTPVEFTGSRHRWLSRACVIVV